MISLLVHSAETDTGSMVMVSVCLTHVEHLTRITNVLSAITEVMESYGRHRKITALCSAHILIQNCLETIAEYSVIMDFT